MRHNNEYTVGTLAAGKGPIYKTPDEAVDDVAFSDESTAVIGTPDDLVAKIHDMMELTGGFGCVIGFVHDWANRENTRRSWDLVARYVIPKVNGLLDDYLDSYKWVNESRETWLRANDARTSNINQHARAATGGGDRRAGRRESYRRVGDLFTLTPTLSHQGRGGKLIGSQTWKSHPPTPVSPPREMGMQGFQ